MATFLFDEIIFGPVFSRRLGISLGINLLPRGAKLCNFNCIYCECGLSNQNSDNSKIKLPEFEDFKNLLESRLKEMKLSNKPLNTITFAGNGEPTLHPDFVKIIDETLKLRNNYFPDAKIAVLTNATNVDKDHIFNALIKIDKAILKLDSVIEKTFKILNSPPPNYNIESIKSNFKQFNGNFIMQSMFVKGIINNEIIDNTTDFEIIEWLKVVEEIKPKQVMIYTIARDTPLKNLEKIDIEKLEEIANRVNKLGIDTLVSG
jgi:wyosine [tRNA(Phe)-imidazoG37] synthetase (radical SAM superfamily)